MNRKLFTGFMVCAWASVTIAQSYYWSMDNTSIVGGGTFSTSGRTYSQKGKFGGAYYTERHPQAHLTTVSFVNSPNINLTTSGNYSLSCWVNVAAYPKSYPNCNETHIISKRANGNQFALLLLSDGQIRFGAWGSGFDIVTGPIIPLNRWVYVAVTVDYDNSIMKIYINGVEMASETLSGKPNGATGDLIFGNTDAAGDYLKQYTGAIDEVKLYNDVVLTEDVILAEASQDITPDHLWRFNDDVYEHRPIKDFTGYADLEFQGTPSLVVGKIGSSAIYFDDNADYVSTKSGITLTQNGNYSLAFWVRSVKYEGVIFNKTTGLNQISSTMHSSGEVRTTIWGKAGGSESSITLNSSSSLPKDAWTHVAVSVDNKDKEARLYINEKVQVTQSFTFEPNSNNDVAEIGNSAGGISFKGCIDDLRIYKNKVLTDTTVQKLYRRKELEGTAVAPIRINNFHQTDRRQYDYEPNFIAASEVTFDSRNKPYIRFDKYIQTLDEKGAWVRYDFTKAIYSAYPAWDGVGYGAFDNRIVFDAGDWAYIFVNTAYRTAEPTLRQTDLILYSTDLCKTWNVLAIGPAYISIWEILSTNNPLNNPPTLMGTRGYTSEPDNPNNELSLFFFKKSGSVLTLDKKLKIADRGFPAVSHSGLGKQMISKDNKVFVAYTGALPASNGDTGTPTYALTVDRSDYSMSIPFYLGCIGGSIDGHNYPSLEMDSKGYLHVVITGHHDEEMIYRVSSNPHSTAAWNTAELIIDPRTNGGGHTYGSLVIDKDDKLHFASRWSGVGYTFTTSYMSKPSGGTWSNMQELLYPRLDNYHVWHHKLALDRKDNLYLNYEYHWRKLPLAAYNAYLVEIPESGLPVTDPDTLGANQIVDSDGVPMQFAGLLTLQKGETKWRLATTPDFINGSTGINSPVPHNYNRNTVQIRRTVGSMFYLPRSSGNNKRQVSIFDLRGRLVYQGLVSEKAVMLGKDLKLGYKVYVVRIREIKTSHTGR